MIENDIPITVQPGCWDNMELSKIEALLKDAASHINKELVQSFTKEIHVRPGNCPLTYYRTTDYPNPPYTVDLAARDCYWCQYTYQFAHEFCHVLSDLDKLKECKNKWFHEAICELASIFTLRRMNGKNWFKNNEKAFQEYEHNNVKERYHQEIKSVDETIGERSINLMDWLSSREEEMREASGDGYKKHRPAFALVAYALLPIFEEDPSGWNTIPALPEADAHIRIREYLDKWQQAVGPKYRTFVDRCKERIESEIIPFET